MIDNEDEEAEEVVEPEPTNDEPHIEVHVEQAKASPVNSAHPHTRESSAKADSVKLEGVGEPNGEKPDSRATSVVVKTED